MFSPTPLHPGPHSARWREEQRRKRARREERERLWREHVCGGPLVDHSAPVMQHGFDYEVDVRMELESRSRCIQVETHALILAFTRGCAIRLNHARQMQADLFALLDRLPVGVAPTHSTHRDVPTTSGTTIPRL